MEQNELGLFDIYDMPHVPLDWSWFYVVISVAIFLILIVVIYALHRKKSQKLTPIQKAFEKINKLSPKHLFTQEQRKQFYFSLGSILKEFFHDQFQFDVMAMTDYEFIEYLSQKKAFSQQVEDIKTITSGLTFIKFAGVDAAQNKMMQDLKLLEDIILKTERANQKQSE